MVEFIFTDKVKKILMGFEKNEQKRILAKLKILKDHPNILSIAKRIEYVVPVTHRLRIGNYRILLQLIVTENKNFKFRVLKLGHRREVYR